MTVLAVTLLASSCGGDSSTPTPPEAELQSVVVAVSTTGDDPDTDGYTVTMGARSLDVASSGSVSFDDVAPGSYEVRLTEVAENCDVQGGASRSLTVGASSGAQVAFAVVCEPEGGGFTIVACPDLVLATSTGMPLDEIAMGSLPPDFQPPFAASLEAGDSLRAGLGFVLTASDGDPTGGEMLGPRLLVPLHPFEPVDGGAIRLTFTDGTLACDPIPFEIEPLPPAEGELAAILDLLQEVLGAQAALFETTPDTLLTTADLPPALLPLAMAQTVLDDPANPGSLRMIANGALGAEALTWVDRILARTSVRSSLESVLAAGAPSDTPGRVSPFQCLPETIGDQASQLHFCMKAAAEAQAASTGLSKKVADDIVSAFGTASELGLPVADVVQAVFSALFWVVYTERNRTSALFPSRFTAMQIDIDPPHFFEDEGTTGQVTRAEVYATSEGYDLLNEIVEATKEAASLAQTTENFDFSSGTDVDSILGEVQGALAETLEQKARDLGTDELKIDPDLFGPVDVNSPTWAQARVAAGEAIAVVPQTMTYVPKLEGEAILSVRTKDGEFGGEQIAAQAEVVIPPLSLRFIPSEAIVPPGDPEVLEVRTFEVRVEGSVSPDSVELDLSHPMQGDAFWLRREPGSDTHLIDYVAPIDPDFDKEDLIVVYHTARAGARANGEERTAIATIRFGTLEISASATSCVTPGQVVTLVAEVEGFEAPTVKWIRDGPATLETTGDLTAALTPTEEGVVTVSAHVDGYPTLDDQLTVQVGDCTCSWSVTLNGVTVESQAGDSATIFEAEPFGPLTGLVGIRLWKGDEGWLALTSADPDTPAGQSFIIPVGPGTYYGSAGGNIAAPEGEESWTTSYQRQYVGELEPEWATATLFIDEYTSWTDPETREEVPTIVRGTMIGRAATSAIPGTPEYRILGGFEVRFDLTIPPDWHPILRARRIYTCSVPEA